jgi:hypothetical protein
MRCDDDDNNCRSEISHGEAPCAEWGGDATTLPASRFEVNHQSGSKWVPALEDKIVAKMLELVKEETEPKK